MFEQIKTIKSFCEEKFKEKGSLFIGQAYTITSEDDGMEILDKIKKEFYDATHHCFAYKLHDGAFKYSDDGEPNGTAGIRILNAIEHFDLTDILVVVIRYFGGVKLGVGPLGKAYYNSAHITLEPAEIIIKKLYKKLIITSDFSHISQIHRLIANYNANIENTSYDDKSHFDCLIELKKVEQFINELNEILKGDVSITQEKNPIFI